MAEIRGRKKGGGSVDIVMSCALEDLLSGGAGTLTFRRLPATDTTVVAQHALYENRSSLI